MRLSGRQIDCIRGGREVFAGLDFEASSGQALAVVGPNGSGKTSLLRLIAGLLVPAGGSVGLEGGEAELTLPEQSHYLGHRDALKPALSTPGKPVFLAGFSRRRPGRHRPMPQGCGIRTRHASAGGISLGRPAAASLDRSPARGAAAGLASGRTDLGARCRRAETVRRRDGQTPRERRHHHCRHPHPARDRGEGTADGGGDMTALAALIRRDIKIALRVGGGALIGVLFFLTVTVLMPFAIGPDLALLDAARTRDSLAWRAAGQSAHARPPVHGRSRGWFARPDRDGPDAAGTGLCRKSTGALARRRIAADRGDALCSG